MCVTNRVVRRISDKAFDGDAKNVSFESSELKITDFMGYLKQFSKGQCPHSKCFSF